MFKNVKSSGYGATFAGPAMSTAMPDCTPFAMLNDSCVPICALSEKLEVAHGVKWKAGSGNQMVVTIPMRVLSLRLRSCQI